MLSVVIPVYNEEPVIDQLARRLRPVLDSLGPYEVIIVDDGSRDETPIALRSLVGVWPELQVISLVRNVGQQLALKAGLDAAVGDWVITMDADLQDPPELIPEMLQRAAFDGVDIVYTRRRDRSSDTFFKRHTAAIYYRLVRRLTNVELIPHVGDYRLMSSRVVLALRAMPERHRIHRVLVPYLGFPYAVLEHRREPRCAGRTKYNFGRLLSLTLDSLSSFSTAPLRLATAFGLMTSAFCLVLAAGAVAAKFAGVAVPGWASLTVAMLFIGAVQLLCLGVMGEYIGRIFEEVKQRPLYLLDELVDARQRAVAGDGFDLSPAAPLSPSRARRTPGQRAPSSWSA